MKRLIPTGEMTLGPFFPREFGQGANDLTVCEGKKAPGEVIEITGRVVQLDGKPLDNLILEIWQADSQGRYDSPDFFGWGRAATNAEGMAASQGALSFTKRRSVSWYRCWWREPHTMAAA